MEQYLTIFHNHGVKYIIDQTILSKLESEFYEAVKKNSLVAIDAQGKIEIVNMEN